MPPFSHKMVTTNTHGPHIVRKPDFAAFEQQAFVIHLLESMKTPLATHKISISRLVSAAAQTGLSLTQSQILNRFAHVEAS